MFGAIIPAPLAIPPSVIVRPRAGTAARAALGNASVVMIASQARGIPAAESEAHSPGRADTILFDGIGTPITPVEETSSASLCSPSASHAAADVSRTAAIPGFPVHAFAFPLFAITPCSRDRDRSPFPQA